MAHLHVQTTVDSFEKAMTCLSGLLLSLSCSTVFTKRFVCYRCPSFYRWPHPHPTNNLGQFCKCVSHIEGVGFICLLNCYFLEVPSVDTEIYTEIQN